MVVVPSGERAPTVGTGSVSSAREIRHLFGSVAPADFVQRVVDTRGTDKEIANNHVLMMLLVDAVRRDSVAQARRIYQWLIARESTIRGVAGLIDARARLFQRIGASELAGEWQRVGRVFADSTSGPRAP